MRKNILFKDIVNQKSLENAIRVCLSIGGSTNLILHALALANELDLDLKLKDFDELSKKTPLIGKFKPAADMFLEDLERCGGVSVIQKELESLLYLDTIDINEDKLRDKLMRKLKLYKAER